MRINLPMIAVLVTLVVLWSYVLNHVARHLHDVANVIHFAGGN